jgi:Restriction endonuclease
VTIRTRLMLQWLGYFSLTLLPSALVLILFLMNRVLGTPALFAGVGLAAFGTFMAIKTIERLRGLRDDEKTVQWLEAAVRRDRAVAEARDGDAKDEKLVAELRGHKDARLPQASARPSYWRGLDDVTLQGQIVRLLKKLGRRVQRSGDSTYRGFDLVIDNNSIVLCKTESKRKANRAALELLKTLRAHPACTAAILVWPKGFPARTRYLARGSDLILWDADNIARLVNGQRLV